ncbi:hypothetical protein Bca52824_045051 [Brassica carinata]|uniref:PHD-type domain-containing protein n=1 Tax=Brassica carinata TaxID=52824 RepID=A0A8X7RD09_BRACI|nr:hypothetical protein Bca52824_045051 [Brassica carinata]
MNLVRLEQIRCYEGRVYPGGGGEISSVKRMAADGGERSGISCKRIKTTLVNGFIVYTRTRRTKLNKVNEEDESKPTNEVAINDPIAESSCVNNTVVENSIEKTAVEERLVTGSLAETNITESSCISNTVVESFVERTAEEERLVTGSLAEIMAAEKFKEVDTESASGCSLVDVVIDDIQFEELLHEAIPVEILSEGSLDFEVAKHRTMGKRYLASKANRHGSLKRTKQMYKSLLRLKKVNNVVSKDAEVLAGSELDGEGLDEQNRSMSLAGISNVVVRKRPDTVRELFETGILDGVSVVYTGTAQSQGFGLRGIITDGGILCSCSSCDWANVITTSQFEIHANKQYKRASQYICFENGKSLLDVLKICRNAPLHSLRAKVLDAVDSASKEKCFTCKRCKGVCPVSSLGHRGLLCLSCSDIENSQSSPTATWTPTSAPACITSLAKSRWKITRKRSAPTLKSPVSVSLLGNRTQEITRKALRQALVGKALSASTNISSHNKCRSEFNMLAQHSVNPKALKSVPLSVSFKKRSCRTTRRDQGLHKLVFEREGLPDGTELGYYARGQKLLGGYKMGAGIYCYCCKCEVSPSVFEAHAGWTSRRKPYFYIYTSNGVSLHEWAMTFSQGRKYSANENDDLLAQHSMTTKALKSVPLSVSSKKRSCRTTRRDQGLHKLVFEREGLPDGTELGYYARGQKLLGGHKMGTGIYCYCCKCEVSPSVFEAHAGWTSRRKPYFYIYTSNGVSLHEWAMTFSQGRKYSANENDDLCVICADGGNLLRCDSCPRAFHIECVSLPSIPRGNWHCKYCEKNSKTETVGEYNVNSSAPGQLEGVDHADQLAGRCIRVVKNMEAETNGCVLCSGSDFCRSGFGPRTIIICDQCEKEYHIGCLSSHNIVDLKELPKGNWFCSMDCTRINSTLQKLLLGGRRRFQILLWK